MIFPNPRINNTKYKVYLLLIKFFVSALLIAAISGCGTDTISGTQTPGPTKATPQAETTLQAEATSPVSSTQMSEPLPLAKGVSRGYLTTPQELTIISQKAKQGMEPYQGAVQEVMQWATKEWKFKLKAH